MPDNPNQIRKLRVFLSHSSSDKEAVRELYNRLLADGFAPWIDDEDLVPGQNWSVTIRNAVEHSDAVLICLSTTSVKKRGYVHKEMLMALDLADHQPEGTIFVIPLRLDECKVPERLSELHYVDLFRDKGYERLKKALYLKAGEIEADGSGHPEAATTVTAAAKTASAPAENKDRANATKPVQQSTPADAPPSLVEKENEGGEKERGGPAIKYQAIIAAVITGLVALTGAYWQFVYKPPTAAIRYSGRVLDSDSRKVIGGASVIVEGDGVPQNYSADSNGIFYIELKTGKDTVRIKVSAEGYAPSDRLVSLSRTGIEEFPLNPKGVAPTPTPSPPPSPSPSPTTITTPAHRDMNKREPVDNQRNNTPPNPSPTLDPVIKKLREGKNTNKAPN